MKLFSLSILKTALLGSILTAVLFFVPHVLNATVIPAGTFTDTVSDLTASTIGTPVLASHTVQFTTTAGGIPASRSIVLTYSESPSTTTVIGSFTSSDIGVVVAGIPKTAVLGSSSGAGHWTFQIGSPTANAITIYSPSDSSVSAGAVVDFYLGASAGGTNRIRNATAGPTTLTIGGGTFSDTSTLEIPITTPGGVSASADVVSSGPIAPTVVTGAATLVTDTTARINGTITNLGGSASVVSWGFTGSFSVTTTGTVVGADLPFDFHYDVTGLSCGTTYTYNATATDSEIIPLTGNGSSLSFTTTACPVILPVISPGGGGAATTTTVNFRGTAYPHANIIVLKDSQRIVVAQAAADGSFIASVAGIGSGSYVFSVYAQDRLGRFSSTYSFPFTVDSKSIVNISNILISPTLALSTNSLTSGKTLTVSGSAAPLGIVTISATDGRNEKTTMVTADAFGNYSTQIASSFFTEDVQYSIHSRVSAFGLTSPFSRSAPFTVTSLLFPDTTKKPTKYGCSKGGSDVNCDGRVDIVDYSILKYWYKRKNPPIEVDLNGDGTVDLSDFSILAADWTG